MSSTEDSDSGLSQSSQVAADIMSILASGDEASFSGFSAVADESKLKKTTASKQNNERGPGKGPGKNKKGKAPVKRGNNVTPSDKDKEREDEFRRIYSKLELLLDRQNSNADRYELASAPEHPVAPEEDEGEGEVDFSQYDIFGNNADDEFESEKKNGKYRPVINLKGLNQEVSSLIGLFTSASCAVLLAPIFHRYLDIEKTLALSKNNDNYDGIMSLSENSRNEILWWIKNVDRNEGKSISFGTPTEYIETDASKIGWGAVYGKK
ncbi:Hypothetical predicted protein [Mytilus galloprovincialis]|uniref:Uncharacterized protein n=1 Tax=Mytilus galloprovincialis TaxID=29158 RepID=A0A8B6G219_MYTGA|nr:Hypothetical predicted protein [Mytilus galloprovincialis]